MLIKNPSLKVPICLVDFDIYNWNGDFIRQNTDTIQFTHYLIYERVFDPSLIRSFQEYKIIYASSFSIIQKFQTN